MTKKSLVSINVLTYNGQDLIEQCLKSVLNQTYKNVEILVVDNASEDKTILCVKKFPVQIIQNKENLGFAAGHNIGIKQSKGEYILCLNQDVILDKEFVKNAIEAIKADERIGAIQGKLYKIQEMCGAKLHTSKNQTIDTTGLMMFKNRRVVSRGQGEEDKNQYERGEVFGVDGAAPLYRRRALEDIKIGQEYFDEDFFMFKEDVDLSWRLRLYNWKIIYESMAIGYHLRGAGEKAAKNYIEIAKARRKISDFAKYHSFKNDRLMRIKNELCPLFFRHFHHIIIKEVGAWIYVLLFEKYTYKTIKALFKKVPKAWRKRKIIMKRKKIGAKEMKKWFN